MAKTPPFFPPIEFLGQMSTTLLGIAEKTSDLRRKVALQTAAAELSLAHGMLMLERYLAERAANYTSPDPEVTREWFELVTSRNAVLQEMQVYYLDAKSPPETLVKELLEVQRKIDQLDPEVAFHGG